MIRSLASIVVLLVLAGCSATATGPRAPSVFETDPAPRAIAYDAAELPTFRSADRAIYGRIVEVGPTPGIWSGIVATYQPVVFEVLRRLDGLDRVEADGVRARGWPEPASRVTIWFGIVGPPDCDPSDARLDPRIYRVGAVGVVAADIGTPAWGDESLRHHADLHARTSFHEMGAPPVALLAAALAAPAPRPR